MYEKYISSLAGFEYIAHISFLTFGNYPRFHNTILYPIFSIIDPLTHFLHWYYNKNDKFKSIHLYIAIWHIIKLASFKLRYNYLTNTFDGIMHGRIALMNPLYGIYGILAYIPLKYLRLTW